MYAEGDDGDDDDCDCSWEQVFPVTAGWVGSSHHYFKFTDLWWTGPVLEPGHYIQYHPGGDYVRISRLKAWIIKRFLLVEGQTLCKVDRSKDRSP
jgi:hypothetical protein